MSEVDEKPISVFVAEDEAIIRLDIVETLKSLGFSVIGEASHGDEVEDQVRELLPDVALLDVQMPGKSGIEIAQTLTRERVCAVVILSAFSQDGLVQEAIDAGVGAYLLKPFQKTEVAVQIRVALARFADSQFLAGEVTTLQQRLSDRVILDRAKGVLIDQYAMGEAEAMKYLQRRAMNERRTVRLVAKDLLDGTIDVDDI